MRIRRQGDFERYFRATASCSPGHGIRHYNQDDDVHTKRLTSCSRESGQADDVPRNRGADATDGRQRHLSLTHASHVFPIHLNVSSGHPIVMKTQEKTLMRKISRTQKKKDSLQKQLKQKRQADEVDDDVVADNEPMSE